MELRAAVPEDALAVARVHVRAWQVGYRGLMPAEYLEGLRAEDRAARYTFGRADGPQTTVAVRDGGVVGFATIVGEELAALHVDPDAWRGGVGRALIVHTRAALAANGVREAHLWVLAGNTRAEQFYAQDGWRTSGVQRDATVWGVTVDERELRRAL